MVTQLAVWADRIGQPLDPATLFHPEFIDRFIHEGCAHLSPGSRINYRTVLWKVGAAVLGHQLFPAPTLPMRRSDLSPPYSHSEVTELVSWSCGLPTENMRRNTRALLAIGLGAGLASGEVLQLVGTDIHRENRVVLINVRGKLARTVPVHHLWADQVLALAEESGARPFFMPARTRIRMREIVNFVSACTGDGPPKFNVQRLRITWIVGHLTAGTHLGALGRAAGVGVVQLGKYL